MRVVNGRQPQKNSEKEIEQQGTIIFHYTGRHLGKRRQRGAKTSPLQS